jgi:hypothetical protein
MKKSLFYAGILILILGWSGLTGAQVIDFTGGTAYLADGTSAITDNNSYYNNVDYYIEDGFKIDFIGGNGIIGDYYSINPHGDDPLNSVLHAHWAGSSFGTITSILFSKVSGETFNLNYVDITSNTVAGGGQSDGSELSYITPLGGTSLLLPSSDWGFALDYYGNSGDDVARLWLDDDFDGITSFTVTSQNASCFGMDNLYIDEEAPAHATPEPGTIMLMGLGLLGLLGYSRKRFSGK